MINQLGKDNPLMKSLRLSLLIALLLLVFTSSAIASDIMLKGSAQFKCNLLSTYMEKRGYPFLEELKDGYNRYQANLYAAKDAEIIIKNSDDTVLLIEKADKSGDFSISLPEGAHKIVVRFYDREIESELSKTDHNNFVADMGHFSSNEVDKWLEKPAMTYCTTCNIRHFKKSFLKKGHDATEI